MFPQRHIIIVSLNESPHSSPTGIAPLSSSIGIIEIRKTVIYFSKKSTSEPFYLISAPSTLNIITKHITATANAASVTTMLFPLKL